MHIPFLVWQEQVAPCGTPSFGQAWRALQNREGPSFLLLLRNLIPPPSWGWEYPKVSCVCVGGGSQEEAGVHKTVTYQQTLEKVCCSVLCHKWPELSGLILSALFVDGTLAGYPHLRDRETEAKQS